MGFLEGKESWGKWDAFTQTAPCEILIWISITKSHVECVANSNWGLKLEVLS